MKRSIAAALLVVALAGLAVAQSPLIVRMPGSKDGVVTPRTIAVVTGLEISEYTIGPIDGELTLAGHTVELDGLPCLITQVTPEGVVFLVPEAVRLGKRTVYIEGPFTARFVDVTVERFWPLLEQQNEFAVATGGLVPIVYVGEPIPVGPGRFNYVTILARGLVTGRNALQAPFSPVVVLERPGERYELAAQAYDVAGFPGTERVAFWAPPCLNGAYDVSVLYAGYVTQSALIRFVSTCTLAPGIRPARIRKVK